MKDQASLNLLIVDSPIDSKALTGHLMLRATSSGLKVYDATGSATELAGGGISEITVGEGLSGAGTASSPLNLNIANYTSQSTISLSSTQGSVNLVGYNSVNLQETFGNKLTLAERGVVITTASGADVLLNEHASNSPSGFVILDNTGKLPAVDGSQLTNLPAATVDLSNYTTTGSVNITANTSMKLTGGAGMQISSSNLTLGDSGGITKIYGITTIDGSLSLTSTEMSPITINGHDVNTSNGLAMLDENGKLPSSILPETSGSVDLSAYTGGINLNSTNDSAVAIKFNSGNPTYNAGLTMDAAGVTLSGYGDVTLQHTGGSYLRLTSGETTLSSNASLTLSAGSRLTISASEGIYLGGAGFNTAGGLVKVGDDGKISSSLYDAGATMATPPLMFTVPSNASGLHLEITAGKLADGTDNAALINTSTADHRAKVLGNSGGTNWITCPDTGFGTNFAGWPVKVDVTGLLDPSEISYIRYRWVPTTGDPSDWYAMVYPCATEAPIPSSGGSGGDTTELENRVTTLESTVGSLDKAVDEILADYGEGSGALVYRVVASATEPTNPTEGMIWIQTE